MSATASAVHPIHLAMIMILLMAILITHKALKGTDNVTRVLRQKDDAADPHMTNLPGRSYYAKSLRGGILPPRKQACQHENFTARPSRKTAIIADSNTIALPPGKYRILYADPKNAGARGIGKSGIPPEHPTLADHGIAPKDSSVAQKLAKLSDEQVDSIAKREQSLTQVLRQETAERTRREVSLPDAKVGEYRKGHSFHGLPTIPPLRRLQPHLL